MNIQYYETIDSTNSEAKRLIASGQQPDCPTVLAARTQTGGRGRQGKSFFSPADTGIYMTVVIRPQVPIASAVTLTTIVSCAVSQVIEECFNVRTGIKWVNDIYVNDRKVCGILCEAVNDYEKGILEYAVIGIGINVSTAGFPEDIRAVAGSLQGVPEVSVPKWHPQKESERVPFGDGDLWHPAGFPYMDVIGRLAERVVEMTGDLSDRSYLKYYRSRSIVIGHDIYYIEDGETRYAHAVDIDPDGGLIIEENGVNKVLRSGEISVRTMK